MAKKAKRSKIRSKKFVVYIYQDKGKGGGSIHYCTSTGAIMTKSIPFADYDEAIDAFEEILSGNLIVKSGGC